MLEFYYDCVDKYISHEDFEYSEMDTDSAYLAISGDSFEALIKPELREEFEKANTTGSSLYSRRKENVFLDSLKSSLKETNHRTL